MHADWTEATITYDATSRRWRLNGSARSLAREVPLAPLIHSTKHLFSVAAQQDLQPHIPESSDSTPRGAVLNLGPIVVPLASRDQRYYLAQATGNLHVDEDGELREAGAALQPLPLSAWDETVLRRVSNKLGATHFVWLGDHRLLLQNARAGTKSDAGVLAWSDKYRLISLDSARVDAMRRWYESPLPGDGHDCSGPLVSLPISGRDEVNCRLFGHPKKDIVSDVYPLVTGWLVPSDVSFMLEARALEIAPSATFGRSAFLSMVGSRLQAADQQGDRALMLLLDIDRFGVFNDMLGHQAGDQLLDAIGERISKCFWRRTPATRRSTLIGHLGADSFAVFLTSSRPREAVQSALSELSNALRDSFSIQDRRLTISYSAGWVESDLQTVPLEMLAMADVALQQAKRRGPGTQLEFLPQMRIQSRHLLTLEVDLREALNKASGLRLEYQPIVDLKTRKTLSFEALVRWRHPQLGEVSPADFVCVAEATGLIHSLGKFVLEQACRDARSMLDQGAKPPSHLVAVNVSRLQLQDDQFPSFVVETLQRNGLDPRLVCLELTESLAMDLPLIKATFDALRRTGVALYLDDFGTGHSSLSELEGLPVTGIKLDRSFLRNVVNSHYQATFVDAILRVARTLGIDVVAEGVEDELQAGLLQMSGCDRAQGWLFSPARPLDELALP